MLDLGAKGEVVSAEGHDRRLIGFDQVLVLMSLSAWRPAHATANDVSIAPPLVRTITLRFDTSSPSTVVDIATEPPRASTTRLSAPATSR